MTFNSISQRKMRLSWMFWGGNLGCKCSFKVETCFFQKAWPLLSSGNISNAIEQSQFSELLDKKEEELEVWKMCFLACRSLNFHLRKSQAGCGSVAGSAAVVRPGLEQSWKMAGLCTSQRSGGCHFIWWASWLIQTGWLALKAFYTLAVERSWQAVDP